MTTIATNDTLTDRRPSVFARIGVSFLACVDARARRNQFMELTALSDAEHTDRGFTRGGIVRHVFADCLYL